MPRPNAVVVLVYGVNTSPDALLPLDRFQIRQEATYVTLQDESRDALSHLNIAQADLLPVASFLRSARMESYDMLLIPGTLSATHITPEAAGDAIRHIFHDRMDAIATGNARVALAASGLLRDRVASSASIHLTDTYVGCARAWDAETKIVRDGGLWTASDDAETLTALSILYKASRHYTIGGVFPLSIWNKYFASSYDEPRQSSLASFIPASRMSGADLAIELAGLSLSGDAQEIADLVFHFAVRLALEGYVDPCNSLLASLLTFLPNAMGSLGDPCMRPIEFLWESFDARPAGVPWNSPSREDLDQWDREYRATHQLPPDEDREDILESVKLRISMSGDWLLTPYTLSGAIVMALDAGWVDQAREWMLKLVQDAYDTDSSHVWTSTIARWRSLAHFCRAGAVVEVTGRTAEQADLDAEAVEQALYFLRPASSQNESDFSTPLFAGLAWDVLVPMLDVLKWEKHETLLKQPASPAAILDAEARLGITLPEDYKQFLLVSNGIEFMPSIDAPGFMAIEALQWKTAKELGLDEFRVDLGCKTDPAEYERLPKMGRVLVISDDSEELVWFVDPETVTEAIHVLQGEGRTDVAVGQIGQWRLVFGANYLTELEWLPSFRGYMEKLAGEAEKVLAT